MIISAITISWEAEIESLNKQIWTLSGNDFKIMDLILPDAGDGQ